MYMSKPSKTTCRYFLQGKCLYGDECNFSHTPNVSQPRIHYPPQPRTLPAHRPAPQPVPQLAPKSSVQTATLTSGAPSPYNPNCRMCKKTYLRSSTGTDICSSCSRKLCVLCHLYDRHSNGSSTCRTCSGRECSHCHQKRRLPESKYCEDCFTFCKGCNPKTPSYFDGPLCQNCQHWCPRCIDFKKGLVENHPGEKYCASCLRDLCCGIYRKHNGYHHDLCLKCRVGKKCTIPCCNNLTYGDRVEKCGRCQKIAHDLFRSYVPRTFNTKLAPSDVSTKYSVTVRYEEVVEEHDGYCGDPVDKFDYHRVIESILPLPSMLDGVADAAIATYSPSDDESDNDSDGVSDGESDNDSDGGDESDDDLLSHIYSRDSFRDSERISGMEKSFPSTYVCDWIDGTLPKRREYTYGNVDSSRTKMTDSKGAKLPVKYHYFYSTTDACGHGSGYCGRHTIYTPLHIIINRL